jgi:spermidine synthase
MGRRAVLVDGVVQSVASEDALGGYLAAMMPLLPPQSALLLGVGGGTVALLLRRQFGPVSITGIDDSAEMLRLAAESFGLTGDGIDLQQADAFAFVHQSEGRFDFIAVDLYRGNRLVRGVLALPFLRALAARLGPGGTVACNLFRDGLLDERLARLERVFERTRLEHVAANTVFHGRPRRRQR